MRLARLTRDEAVNETASDAAQIAAVAADEVLAVRRGALDLLQVFALDPNVSEQKLLLLVNATVKMLNKFRKAETYALTILERRS